MRLGLPELIIVLIVGMIGTLLVIWPASRVCKKAGFSPWMGLLGIMPVVLFWVLAIAEWPASRNEPGRSG